MSKLPPEFRDFADRIREEALEMLRTKETKGSMALYTAWMREGELVATNYTSLTFGEQFAALARLISSFLIPMCCDVHRSEMASRLIEASRYLVATYLSNLSDGLESTGNMPNLDDFPDEPLPLAQLREIPDDDILLERIMRDLETDPSKAN